MKNILNFQSSLLKSYRGNTRNLCYSIKLITNFTVWQWIPIFYRILRWAIGWKFATLVLFGDRFSTPRQAAQPRHGQFGEWRRLVKSPTPNHPWPLSICKCEWKMSLCTEVHQLYLQSTIQSSSSSNYNQNYISKATVRLLKIIETFAYSSLHCFTITLCQSRHVTKSPLTTTPLYYVQINIQQPVPRVVSHK